MAADQAAGLEIETEATNIERDPEIIRLKKEIRKEQLELEKRQFQKKRLKEAAEIEEIEELYSKNKLLKRKLEQELKLHKLWVNAPCPECKGKFFLRASEAFPRSVRCFVCGKWWNLKD